MQSTTDRILARINGKGGGFSFSTKDFLDVGSRASVAKSLSTLAETGEIRRVCRGIYDFPRFNPDLGGELSPDFDQVARAIARKNGIRAEASGAWAANLLGLSTQVPAKIVYLTNGTSRTYEIGGQTIEFKRVGPKELIAKKPATNLVIQALRHLGKDHVDDDVVRRLRERLSSGDRKALLKDARYSADWLYEIMKKIVNDGNCRGKSQKRRGKAMPRRPN